MNTNLQDAVDQATIMNFKIEEAIGIQVEARTKVKLGRMQRKLDKERIRNEMLNQELTHHKAVLNAAPALLRCWKAWDVQKRESEELLMLRKRTEIQEELIFYLLKEKLCDWQEEKIEGLVDKLRGTKS